MRYQAIVPMRILLTSAVFFVLSACNNDALNIANNAGDPKLEDLKNSLLLTDNEFAPKIESITLYDICGESSTNSNGYECNPAFNNASLGVGQTAVNSPVRVLVTMDKPVYLDEGAQENIVLQNAEFFQRIGTLQPVVAPNSVNKNYTEPNNDPATLQKNKFLLFSTEHTSGHIFPARVDSQKEFSVVTVTIPAGFVYDININNKKIYNKSFSTTFNYDTKPPKPVIKLLDEQGIIVDTEQMSSSIQAFGEIKMEIDWQEPVTINEKESPSLSAFARDSGLLSISCRVTSNCLRGRQRTDEYVYFGENGLGRTFDVARSTKSKYLINLIERDYSGDQLIALQDGTQLEFEVAEEVVRDQAGNLSIGSDTSLVSVDAMSPQVQSVYLGVAGALNFSGGVRVLSIGDALTYRVTTTEPVSIKKEDGLVISFGIGDQLKQAEVDFVASNPLLGAIKSDWTLAYTIREGDGDNLLADNDISYTGDPGPSLGWRSDIGVQYDIVSEDNVFDRVANPLLNVNFRDRQFDNDQDSGNFVKLHIDGIRPLIDEAYIERYSRRLSVDISTDANVIANGKKLAIAAPFSEDLLIPGLSGNLLSFDTQTWSATALDIQLFADTDGLDLEKQLRLTYDEQLTAVAQSDPYFAAHAGIVVYSIIVNETYTRTSSIQVVGLSGKPGGYETTSLRDTAGNTFNEEQAKNADSFSLSTLMDIGIDGGPFVISNVYPVYSDADGELIPLSEDAESEYYIEGDTIYIGVDLSRTIVGTLGNNPPKLVLGIRNADPALSLTDVEVESSSVQFARGDSGDISSTLIFGFSLREGTADGVYEDVDGVDIISITDPSSSIIDENNTPLNVAVSSNNVRGDSTTLTQILVDNKPPVCSDAYLTDKPSGEQSIPAFTVYAKQKLYASIACDQNIIVNEGPNGVDDQPIIYSQFGAEALGTVFRFLSLENSEKRLVYELPVEFGYRAGDGQLLLGEQGGLTLDRYYNSDLAQAGTHVFFTDPLGNPIDLDFSGDFLIDQKIFDSGSLNPDKNLDGSVIIDTTPVPVAVEYSVSDNGYVDGAGTRYIPGGLSSRQDEKNTLTIKVTYGYFDDESNPQARTLVIEGDEDVSIDVYYSDGNVAGQAVLRPGQSTPTEGILVYEMQVGYASTLPSVQTLRSIDASTDTLRPVVSAFLPYVSDDVVNYTSSGAPLSVPSISETPISTGFTAAVFGSFPTLEVNNTQPDLKTAAGEAIEVWIADPADGTKLTQLNDGVNTVTVLYGDVYFALVFDKDISEDTFSDAQMNVNVNTTAGLVGISQQDILWQAQEEIATRYPTNINSVTSGQKVFYKFNYGSSRYIGDGFRFKDPLLSPNPGTILEDIFGNEADITQITAAALASLPNGYDVTIDSITDIIDISFNQELYSFGDTITITLIAAGRVSIENVSENQVLALQAQITVDENGTPAEDTIYLTHNSINEIAPSNTYLSGATEIVFTYTLDNKARQYDDDTTSDTDMGIQLIGQVQRCNLSAVSALGCSNFQTQRLTETGAIERQASLVVDELVGINQLAGVNTVFPYFLSGSNITDLLTFKYDLPAPLTGTSAVTSSETLRAGDILVFEISAEMQSGTTSLDYDTAGDPPLLNFRVFDIVTGLQSSKQANLRSVTSNTLVFAYTLQPGDYIGTPEPQEAITLFSGLETVDERPMKFNTSSMITSVLPGVSLFPSIVDNVYDNPLSGELLDSTGAVTRQQYDYSTDLKVDTRPYITAIESITPAGTYGAGEEIRFKVRFSEDVNVVGAGFDVSIDGRSIFASYSAADTTIGSEPVFVFSSVPGLNGIVSIPDFSADGVVSYIRSNSGININPDIRGITPNAAYQGLIFDSVVPVVASLQLISNSGVYSTATSNNVLRIRANLDTNVNIVGTGTELPTLRVQLDTKGNTTQSFDLQYKGGDATATNQIDFELDISSLPNSIQDYDGITIVGQSISIPTGYSIADSSANALATNIASFISDIEDLTINIDTSIPTVTEIIELKGAGVSALVDYSADAEIVFRMTFDETVDLSSSTPSDYALQLNFDATADTAVLKLDTTPDTADSRVYYFTLNTGEKYDVARGQVELTGFTVASGSTIQDKARLPFAFNLAAVNQDFSQVEVDAFKPTVTSVSLPGGLYADAAKLEATVSFSENIAVIGSPEINITLSNSGNGYSVNRAFTYDASNSGNDVDTLVFTYTVDSLQDNSTDTTQLVLAPPTAFSSGIIDGLGNTVAGNLPTTTLTGITISPNLGASVVTVEAYIKQPNVNVQVINPLNQAVTLLAADTLYMVVEYNRAVTIPSANTANIELRADKRGGTDEILQLDITSDTQVLDADQANKLVFALESIPSELQDTDGVRITPQLSVTGGSGAIDVDGLSSQASLDLTGKIVNDLTGDDNILETILVNTAAPEITDVTTDSNGYFSENDTITFRVTFSTDISLQGLPRLSLDIGGTDRTADNVQKVASNQLTFTYLVLANDNDLDGITVTSLHVEAGQRVFDVNDNAITSPVSRTDNLDSVFIDNIAPALPVLLAVIDSVGDRTGDISSDIITDDSQLDLIWQLVDGTNDTVVSGYKIQLFGGSAGDVQLGQAYTVTEQDVTNGKVTLTSTLQFSGSQPLYKVTMSDLAGNTSAATGTFTILIDSIAPDQPTISIRDEAGIRTDNDVIDGESVDSNELIMRVIFDQSNPEALVVEDNIARVYDGNTELRTETLLQRNITDGFLEVLLENLVFGKEYVFYVTITDTAGNISRQSNTIAVRIVLPPEARPFDFVTDPNAPVVPAELFDQDANGAYSRDDVLSLYFNQPISFQSLSNDKDLITVSEGTLGIYTMTNPTPQSGGYTNVIRMTFDSGVSPDLVRKTLTIPAHIVLSNAGLPASEAVTFTLPDPLPGPRLSQPLEHIDNDNNGTYSTGDNIILHFNLPVQAARLSGSTPVADLIEIATTSNNRFLGLNPSISPTSGNTRKYTITLGTTTDLAVSDEIRIPPAYVRSDQNKDAINNSVFVLTDNAPNIRREKPVEHRDNDDDDLFTEGDEIILHFNQRIGINNANFDDPSDVVVLPGKSLGTGASLTALSPASGSSESYRIILGSTPALVDGDVLLINAGAVTSSGGLPSTVNTVFILPDITPPAIARLDPYVLDHNGDNIVSAGDEVLLELTEPVVIAELEKHCITVNRNVLQSVNPVSYVDPDGDGLASVIRLGVISSGRLINPGDQIRIREDCVRDASGNIPFSDRFRLMEFNPLPSTSSLSASISDISIDAGHYTANQEIRVKVTFTDNVTVSLDGSTMTISLNVGGSIVTAEVNTTDSTNDQVVFVYQPSGAIDRDGIEVVGSSISKGGTSDIVVHGTATSANLEFPAFQFPQVTVYAPFSVSTASIVWLDATDIDGDGQASDQAEGDLVPTWKDKSGADNHVSILGQSEITRQPTIRSSEEKTGGRQAVYFDGVDDRLSKDGSIVPALTNYTYYAVASDDGTSGYGLIVSTRKGIVQGTILYSQGYAYRAWVRAGESWNNSPISYKIVAPRVLGDRAIAGIVRVSSSDGSETIKENISNIVNGGGLFLGATGAGGGLYFYKGYTNEVLYYARSLNQSERYVVNNYLSSKWGTGMALAVDKFTEDNTADGYGANVTGIILIIDPSGDSSVSAAQQGSVGVESSDLNGFLKDNNDSVFLGYKNEVTTMADKPSGALADQIANRIWSIDIRDQGQAGGLINISIDPFELGLAGGLSDPVKASDSQNYELYWRAAQSGSFTRISIGRAFVNGRVEFGNLQISDAAASVDADTNTLTDGYITFATVDTKAPTLRSAEINGTLLSLTFDEQVTGTLGIGSDESVDVNNPNRINAQLTTATAQDITIPNTVLDVKGNSFAPKDYYIGTDGDDSKTINANNIAIGGKGDDTFTANSGVEIFDYNFITDGNDTINNFAVGTDKINLSELLLYRNDDNILDYINILASGSDLLIEVDSHGRKRFTADRDISITLNGVSQPTDIEQFITDNIITLSY